MSRFHNAVCSSSTESSFRPERGHGRISWPGLASSLPLPLSSLVVFCKNILACVTSITHLTNLTTMKCAGPSMWQRKWKAKAHGVRKQRSECFKEKPPDELECGPFKKRSGWAPLGAPRLGLCLKTTRSNLHQDADISRSCAGGQVGSRLPLTRREIKTGWADPAGSGGVEETERRGVKKTTGNRCTVYSAYRHLAF